MKTYCQCCSKQFVSIVCDQDNTVSKHNAVHLIKGYMCESCSGIVYSEWEELEREQRIKGSFCHA